MKKESHFFREIKKEYETDNFQKGKSSMYKKAIILICIILLLAIVCPIYKIRESAIMIVMVVGPSVLTYILYAESNKDTEAKEVDEIYENIRGSIRGYNVRYGANLQVKNEIKESSDILELMLANMKEIRDYYALSKTQAKNSFFLAVIMCIAGVIYMGIAISMVFINSENIEMAILPAVGATIVDFIAGTAILLYKKSLTQLNHYYNSLHNNERFLSIVNIISKVSPEKQDEMYFEIIKSQIEIMLKKETELINNDKR